MARFAKFDPDAFLESEKRAIANKPRTLAALATLAGPPSHNENQDMRQSSTTADHHHYGENRKSTAAPAKVAKAAKVGEWVAEDWQAFFDERAGVLEYDCGLRRPAAEAEAFQDCVVAWLNHYPAASPSGRCSWCGHPDSRDVVVLPYGTGPHIWLHGKCWSSWRTERQAKAAEALASMGVGPRGTP